MPVELVRTSSYEPAIAAMRAGKIDIMNFGSQAYLIAEGDAGAEAFAVRGQPNGQPLDYLSLIIAPSDSTASSLNEIAAQPDNVRALFTDLASTSGYLVANASFAELGLDPATQFASAEFTGSHALSILKIAHGEADIACVINRVLRSLVDQGKIDPTAIKILWKSRPIPTGPVAYRSDLSAVVKQRIREAYFELPQRSAETYSVVSQIHPEEPFIYIPCPTGSLSWLRDERRRFQEATP